MSDELIIRHASPTLAGLKTGNLFNSSTPPAYLPRVARSEGAIICAPLRSAGGYTFSNG